jgi:hypothetical protein
LAPQSICAQCRAVSRKRMGNVVQLYKKGGPP